MAFMNDKGQAVSYECSELIEDLKEDIQEFGGDTIIAVWCKRRKGVILYTNYDFIESDPIDETELKDGEFLKQMTMSALLVVLEKQNSIL